ncbi:hypothetical protein D9M70_534630 [compost metagenome]
MHGVRTKQHEIRAADLDLARGLLHEPPKFIPLLRMLQCLDFLEADGGHDAAGIVVPAHPGFHVLVDQPVVLGGRLPAHAADQSDGFHALIPLAQSGPCDFEKSSNKGR